MKIVRSSAIRVLVVLFPVWYLLWLRFYVSGTPYQLLGSAFLGALAGFGLKAVLHGRADLFLFSPLKAAALLFPVILAVGFRFFLSAGSVFYAAFFAVQFLLLYLAFLRRHFAGIEKTGLTVALAGIFLAAVFCVISYPAWSSDSYSYYDMSRNLFTAFGRVATQRQYMIDTEYGISFPYLYPALIAAVDHLTGLRMYSGVVINLLAAAASVMALMRLSVRYTGEGIAGAVSALMLCCNRAYLGEVSGARAVPAAIFCALMVLWLLFPLPDVRPAGLFFAGLFAGAAAVIRFDAAVVALLAGAAVFVVTRGRRLRSAAWYLLGCTLCLLPWMVFSLSVFGRLWMSDNTGTLFYIQLPNPQHYFLSSPPTLFSHPGEWLHALLTEKLPSISFSFAECALNGGGLFFAGWIAAGIWRARGAGKKTISVPENGRFCRVCLAAALIYAGKFALFVLVGYPDTRYHTETWILLVFFAAGLFSQRQRRNGRRKEKTEAISLTVLSLCAAAQIVLAPWLSQLPVLNRIVSPYEPRVSSDGALLIGDYIRTSEDLFAIEKTVTAETADPRVLFLNAQAYQFGAFTGIRSFARPYGDPDALTVCIDTVIRPDFIVDTEPDEALINRYELKPVLDLGYAVVYAVNRAAWR